jgi:hypothetical protein
MIGDNNRRRHPSSHTDDDSAPQMKTETMDPDRIVSRIAAHAVNARRMLRQYYLLPPLNITYWPPLNKELHGRTEVEASRTRKVPNDGGRLRLGSRGTRYKTYPMNLTRSLCKSINKD